METKLAKTGGDAVKVALDRLRNQSKNGTTVEKSSSFTSTKEEEALLVLNDEMDSGPNRLTNPTAEYELESQDVVQEEKRTTNFSTLMHLLKGNIGTGILAMPSAVSNAGLVVGTIGIPVLGVLCVHCMHILVNSSKTIATRIGRPSLDYSTTAEKAFALGPRPFRRCAKFARYAVNTMLMMTQFGFCCVYFLFVGKSVEKVIQNVSGANIDFKWYMTILLPFMIVLNFVPTLKKLTIASSIANVIQISGLCMLFYFLTQHLPQTDSVPAVASLAKMPLYFGTAIYAFEGIGVVLPLENKMATPDAFRGLNGVLNTAMVIVACLYTGIGFYGYLKFGDKVKGSITFNLNVPVVSDIVRIMFAVAIFLSYPLQLYVPIQIFWPYVQKKFGLQGASKKREMLFNFAFRSLLVCFTFLLAIAIPMLDLFISLVGALASSSLALIFPPLIELMTVWNTSTNKKYLCLILFKDIIIIVIGVIGFVLGTYTSLKEIIVCFGHPEKCDNS